MDSEKNGRLNKVNWGREREKANERTRAREIKKIFPKGHAEARIECYVYEWHGTVRSLKPIW